MARLHQLKQLKPGLTILGNVPNIEPSKAGVLSVTTAINKISATEIGTTVLLLDAENLRFNTEIENFLTTVCTYPI